MRNLWLAAMLVGCSTQVLVDTADTGDSVESGLFEDVGTACLTDTAVNGTYGAWPQQFLDPDQVAYVTVTIGERGGCDTVVAESCTVALDGAVLTIEASAEIELAGPGITCTTASFAVQVSCETPALPAGDYTVSYGGSDQAMTIPHAGDPFCVTAGL